jgi:haloalkane dehalogenase
LTCPSRSFFGADDPYLNPDLADHLAGLFRHADVHVIQDASHWPQWDQPERVAQLIKQAAPTP